MYIEKRRFGELDGIPVDLYRLGNGSGTEVEITNYGAIITALRVRDCDHKAKDVVLGYDNLQSYVADSFYLGAIIGRYANRIAGGRFILNGREYVLAQNNGPNHLHGGVKGFSKVIWQAEPVEVDGHVGLQLNYFSPDGEEGYPGNLEVQVTYLLDTNHCLTIDYLAETDKPTVLCLSQHSYFNLGETADILDHEVQLHASCYTPVDRWSIPTGEILPVADTRLDFTERKMVKEALVLFDQDEIKGLDHNYVVDGTPSTLRFAAQVKSEDTGIIMTMHTTEPAVHFYTGNYLDGVVGKDGSVYNQHAGLCLEAQHFPDSPNHKNFPGVVLNPGEIYRQRTVYGFTLKEEL